MLCSIRTPLTSINCIIVVIEEVLKGIVIVIFEIIKLLNINRLGRENTISIQQMNQFMKKKTISTSSEVYIIMVGISDEARKITMKMNNAYHNQGTLYRIFSELTGKVVDYSFSLFAHFIPIMVKILL